MVEEELQDADAISSVHKRPKITVQHIVIIQNGNDIETEQNNSTDTK